MPKEQKLPPLRIGSKKFPSSLNRIMNMIAPPLGNRSSMLKRWLVIKK